MGEFWDSLKPLYFLSFLKAGGKRGIILLYLEEIKKIKKIKKNSQNNSPYSPQKPQSLDFAGFFEI